MLRIITSLPDTKLCLMRVSVVTCQRQFVAVATNGASIPFEDFNSLVCRGATEPGSEIIVVDVREPKELVGGKIPTSINIPLGEFEAALQLPADQFQKKFGRAKPDASKNKLIVHCRSGVRSEKASQAAQKLGYKVQNYTGSWLDWNTRHNLNASY